jgi:hypothetical protein
VQVLSAAGTTAQVNNATVYSAISGGSAWQSAGASNDARVRSLITSGGTLGGLRAVVPVAPGGTGTWAITVMQNGNPTSLTCTITSAATTCQDVNGAHDVTVTAGDQIYLRSVPTNTPTSANLRVSTLWRPTTADQTVWPTASAGDLNTTAQNLMPLGASATANSNTSLFDLVVPIAGTIKNLYTNCASTAAASTRVFTLNKTHSGTALTCTQTGTATTCNDTADSISVVAGDVVNIGYTATGTPGAAGCGLGLTFVPTTSGRYVVGNGIIVTSPTTSTDQFAPLSAANFTGATTEDAIVQRIAQASTIKNIYVVAGSTIGSGSTLTVTLNNGTGTPTAETCNFTASTTCNASVDVAVADDALLDTNFHHTNTAGTGRQTGVSYSAVFTGTFP